MNSDLFGFNGTIQKELNERDATDLSFEDITFDGEDPQNSDNNELLVEGIDKNVVTTGHAQKKKHKKDKFNNNNNSISSNNTENNQNPNNMLIFKNVKEKDDMNALIEMCQQFGSVKAWYYTDSCGYVMFNDQEALEIACNNLQNLEVNGQKIAVDKPLFALEKNNTLVLKNLPFNLKTEKLQEILNNFEVRPTSVNYHVDASGMFRGMAFAKYKNIDESSKAYELLNGLEVAGRKIRVEFKRKSSNASANPSQQKLEKEKQEKTPEKQYAPNVHLDLDNLDDDTKKFYEQLIAFKENPTMTEISFPHTLTSYQKKQIHHLADKLGLSHFSLEGDGKNISQRHMLVIKKGPASYFQNTSSVSSEDNNNANFSGIKRKNSRTKNWSIEKNKDSENENHAESSKNSYSNHSVNIPQTPAMKSSPKLSPSFPTGSPVRVSHLRNSLSIQPVRQPRGPDGSRGFAAGRGKFIQSVS